jgi:hypothetical protein
MNKNLEARPPQSAAEEDDSPAAVLQHLEKERGGLFTESEYREIRDAVLEELAFGARLRPFTIFTFVVVELGLAALFLVGMLGTAHQTWGDSLLAWISGVALLSGAAFFWFLWQGVRKDRLLTLDERLGELETVRVLKLITADEHAHLKSHILQQRQCSRRV